MRTRNAADAYDGPEHDVPKPVLCTPRTALPGAQAIQITRLTKVAVLEWVGGWIGRGGLLVRTKEGARPVFEGDWVVRTYDGGVYVVPDTLFNRLYETRKVRRLR